MTYSEWLQARRGKIVQYECGCAVLDSYVIALCRVHELSDFRKVNVYGRE